jgi:Domain of unknown function (DUF4476)
MKKYIFLLSLIFSLKSIAQQNRFIYLQTEGKQPFYVKLNKKILSSSSSGYLIIPKLTEGNYTLLVGFPKNEWIEQVLTVTIQKNDLGFLVKNFNEKGWGLVDMNTYQVVYNTNNVNQSQANKINEKSQIEIVTAQPNENLLVKQNNLDVVKENTKPVQKNDASLITKLFTSKSNNSFESVYVIKNINSIDTVRVFISSEDEKKQVNQSTPTQVSIIQTKEQTKTTPIQPEQPVIKEVDKPIEQKKQIEEVKSNKNEIAPSPNKQTTYQSNCKSLANEDDYKKLRKKMASADSDNEMLSNAYSYFQKKCYTTDQIKTLSYLFLTDEGKYKFFDTAYPYVYDIDNFYKLSQILSEEYYIKRFNVMLKN